MTAACARRSLVTVMWPRRGNSSSRLPGISVAVCWNRPRLWKRSRPAADDQGRCCDLSGAPVDVEAGFGVDRGDHPSHPISLAPRGRDNSL